MRAKGVLAVVTFSFILASSVVFAAWEEEAHDGVDLISKGKHERFIINKDKFDSKMKEKITKKVT